MSHMNPKRLIAVAGLLGTSSMFGGSGFKSLPSPKILVVNEEKMNNAEAKRRRKAEKRLACK